MLTEKDMPYGTAPFTFENCPGASQEELDILNIDHRRIWNANKDLWVKTEENCDANK